MNLTLLLSSGISKDKLQRVRPYRYTTAPYRSFFEKQLP